MRNLLFNKLMRDCGIDASTMTENLDGSLTFTVQNPNTIRRNNPTDYPYRNGVFSKPFCYEGGAFPENRLAQRVRIEKVPIELISVGRPVNSPPDGEGRVFSKTTANIPAVCIDFVNTANVIANEEVYSVTNLDRITDLTNDLLTVEVNGSATKFKDLLNTIISTATAEGPTVANCKEAQKEGVARYTDIEKLLALFIASVTHATEREIDSNGQIQPNSELSRLLTQLTDSGDDFPRKIHFSAAMVQNAVEKEAKESFLLQEIMTPYLQLEQCSGNRHLIADIDAINNPNSSFNKSLQNQSTPLFISTTSGEHAFAVVVDFQNNRLIVANPVSTDASGGEIDQGVIDALQRRTGFNTVIKALTEPMPSGTEIQVGTQNVCRATALILSGMLIDRYKQHIEKAFSEGCLNYQTNRVALDTNQSISDALLTEENLRLAQSPASRMSAPAGKEERSGANDPTVRNISSLSLFAQRGAPAQQEHNVPAKSGDIINRCLGYCDEYIKNLEKTDGKETSKYTLASQIYQSLKDLKSQQEESHSIADKIRVCKDLLANEDNQEILSTRRDSNLVGFLKGITIIIPLYRLMKWLGGAAITRGDRLRQQLNEGIIKLEAAQTAVQDELSPGRRPRT